VPLACALQYLILAFFLTRVFAQATEQDVETQAATLIHAGKLDQAEALLRSASATHDSSAALHGALGDLLLNEHKYEDAVMELGRAAQLEPASRKYNLLAAEALIGWEKYPTAVDFLKAVQPRFDNDPHFHYVLGLAYFFESNLNEAIPQLEEAVRLSPKFDRARFLLANCLLGNGQTEKALDILRKLTKEHPDNAFYWATMGQRSAHINIGSSPEESVRAVSRALELAPGDSYIQFLAATVFTETGDYKRSRPLLEHLEKIVPQQLEIHAMLVRVYSRLGEHELAGREAETVDQLQKEQTAAPSPAMPSGAGTGSPEQP
jgi:predicted Zn-dependent protease